MNTNVNLAASLGALAFLGTGFVLLVCSLFLAYSLFVKKFERARMAMGGIALVAGLYLALLLIFSFVSSEKVLARGQEKHFCEIDCHLAYSIADSKQSKTIGNVTASGVFALVAVKTRFDEATIGQNRGDGQLFPNSRVLTIVDDQGRRYSPSAEGQQALASSGAAGMSLATPLRPGESYLTTVAFDLPTDAKNLTLLINENDWVTSAVIGHENSLFHKQTRFQL
jgi:hypothetical protein